MARTALATLALAAGGPAFAGDDVARWIELTERARAHLDRGEAEKARRLCRRVAHDIGARGTERAVAARLLARAEMLQSVSELVLGRTDSAVWRWHVARNLDPALDVAELDGFGESGAVLRNNLLWEETEVRRGSRVGAGGGRRFSPPRVRRRRPVTTPAALPRAGGRGRVMVRVLVDLTGRPRSPEVLYSSGGPLVTHAALSALESWRFEPARLDGRPVLFLSMVTVEFESGGPGSRRP